MNIKVFQNRKVSKDYFDNEGTQNENYSTTLSFEFPLGYEDFSKRIVFITEDGNFWDYIKDNEYVIKNNITKYENVEAYLWLTKDNQDFRSETFELNFYENQNPDNMTPSEEQLDGYNTLIAELELKVEEVDALKEETLEALEKLKEQQIDYENRFEEINDMLKELKDTNEYQSEIIDQFKNEFDEKEFEGASAHLPDSAELPLKLQPQGNIEQDTREGYNELDTSQITETSTLNGVTRSYDKKTGIITLNGTGTADNSQLGLMPVGTERILNGKYTLFVEYISGTLSNETSNTNVQIQNNTTWYDGIVVALKNNSVLNARNRESFTANYYVIRYDTGVVFNNYKIRVMLIKGLYTLDTIPKFELYGSMPSIAFPSEVKGVSGHYDTVVENKNICSEIESGNINSSGANYEDTTSIRSKNYDLVQPNSSYIASKNGLVSTFNISEYDKNKTFIKRTYYSNGLFTTSSTTKYVKIQTTGSITDKIQLEVGTVVTPYIDHQAQNYSIDIPVGQTWYSGKPYKENGKWYRPIEWYKEKITSSNVLQKNSFGTNCYALSRKYATRVKGNEKIVFSNYFKGISYNDRTNGIKDSIYNEASYIVIRDTTFTTVEELKTFLDNNNVYIVYQLATPTIEEITDTTLIAQLENIQRAFSYYPVTNVNSYKPTVNVADLILNGKYYVSNKAKFKTLEERVSALENETVNE